MLVQVQMIRHFKEMAGYRSFLFPEAELAEDFALLDARESHHLIRVALQGRNASFAGCVIFTIAEATHQWQEAVEDDTSVHMQQHHA